MNNEQLKILAEIYACNARVLGMQAENLSREARGDAPAYGHGHFIEEAEQLDTLAQQAWRS